MPIFGKSFDKTTPVGVDPANALDTYIRDLVKVAVAERYALEHYALDSAEVGADDSDNANAQGRHVAGVVGCMFVGTTVEISDLTGMGKGAIVFDTTFGYFRVWDGGWVNVPVVQNPLTVDELGLVLYGPNNMIKIGPEVAIPGVGYAVPYALTDAASIVVDASKSNVFTVTLGGNRALANPSNLKTGCTYAFIISQDAVGSKTLVYGTTYTFADSIAPELSTGSSAVDILSCIYDGSKLRCVLINNFG